MENTKPHTNKSREDYIGHAPRIWQIIELVETDDPSTEKEQHYFILADGIGEALHIIGRDKGHRIILAKELCPVTQMPTDLYGIDQSRRNAVKILPYQIDPEPECATSTQPTESVIPQTPRGDWVEEAAKAAMKAGWVNGHIERDEDQLPSLASIIRGLATKDLGRETLEQVAERAAKEIVEMPMINEYLIPDVKEIVLRALSSLNKKEQP